MKTPLFFRLLFILVMGVFFSFAVGCVPDPVEPEKGEKGEKGDKGDKGDPGNANVLTYRVSISSSNYINYSSYYGCHISLPQLSANIALNGTVLVYFERGSGSGVWLTLPFTDHLGGKSTSMLYSYTTGVVNLYAVATDFQPYLYPGNCKIVLIAGTAGKQADPVDYSNYEAVKAYYNLQDADEEEIILGPQDGTMNR